MDINEIRHYAPIKGLNLVGTGDFTHPRWFRELREKLVEVPHASLYEPTEKSGAPVAFVVTGEVSTIFTFKGETKKIHHLILTPSLEIVEQINDRLTHYGSLSIDGRPVLDTSAPQLVEEVMEVSPENVVIPAHVWTPWFSLFGSFSGFDRIEDCYQDMTKHIFALETGLSSDPPMNWRLSALDKYTLISNSDCHSPWPWRIGREANVFNLEELTYYEVVDAIKSKDPERLNLTIETCPDYGKYHWTGHRNCNISLPPKEAIKFGSICPRCRKKLTKGVEQRVEELADRPPRFKPKNVPSYMRLLPLGEVIQAVLGVTYPGVQKVWNVYNDLISRFGDEYTVLTQASLKDMAETVDPRIAEAVIRVREERVKVVPGYDGVYGQIAIFEEPEEEKAEEEEPSPEEPSQRSEKKAGPRSLADFM